VRNLRRPTFGSESERAIVFSSFLLKSPRGF
jgi:hypothetical protein